METVEKEIKSGWTIGLSLFILLVPDVLFNSELTLLSVGTIFSKFCLIGFLGFWILYFSKSYWWTYLIIGIPYLLSSFAEIINVLVLDSYMNSDDFKALYFTSSSEVLEFFRKFHTIFIIPLVIIGLYVIFLIRYNRMRYSGIHVKKLILSSLGLLVLSLTISVWRMVEISDFYSDGNRAKIVFRRCYVYEHPFNFYYRILRQVVINKRNKECQVYKQQFRFNVVPGSETDRPDVVVFIIGEAMRYANWSVNGYHKETSPGLQQCDNLISFAHHFSTANCTSNSIPLLITQATPHTISEAYHQKTIVSLFKEAGYETSWISSTIDVLNYLDNRDEPDYLCDLRNDYRHQTDKGILPALQAVLNKPGQRKFIVINMRGWHDRPPEDFQVFTPNSSHKHYAYAAKNREVFLNDYDNMICFQDNILCGVIKLLKSKKMSSLMVFTSDHATHLFDEGQALFGYGSAHPTVMETHVPLFIWGSSRYLKDGSCKFNNLKRHTKLMTTNDHLFYTLADLANINYETFTKSKSLADSLFLEPTSRFVFTNDGIFEFKREPDQMAQSQL